jgi:segregation and condensation protein B
MSESESDQTSVSEEPEATEGPYDAPASEAPSTEHSHGDGSGVAEPEHAAAAEDQARAEAPAQDADPYADLPAKVEAALLTADRALSVAKMAEALGVTAKAVQEAITALNEHYQQSSRSFRIESVAGGYKVLTLPEYASVLQALHKSKAQSRLSPAAMETLAIIAYKQPILRTDLENIRGVASGEVLRSLMDRQLVKIVGRAEEIGRPMLYGTTKTFLETFGLTSLKDLPSVEKLNPGSAQ